jgi:hypothetical protein
MTTAAMAPPTRPALSKPGVADRIQMKLAAGSDNGPFAAKTAI